MKVFGCGHFHLLYNQMQMRTKEYRTLLMHRLYKSLVLMIILKKQNKNTKDKHLQCVLKTTQKESCIQYLINELI